jgi:hypothetical protein
MDDNTSGDAARGRVGKTPTHAARTPRRNTLKRVGIVAGVLLLTVAAVQAIRPAGEIPLTDSSRSLEAQPGIPNALAAVLTRSCGDCHSNVMVPGWYTRVPPFSTLMSRGATEGRKAVDFSEWAAYSAEQQRALLSASCTDARLGKMPMKVYVRFRRDAELSAQDVATICSAARQLEQMSATGAALRTPREP